VVADPSVTRRQLIAGRLSRAWQRAVTASQAPSSRKPPAQHVAPAVHKIRSLPVLRPPRAVNEERFLRECTRCLACMEACPQQAIIPAPGRFRQSAGTPMIDPQQQPCWMCEDQPCLAACEPAVLSDAWPRRMGSAHIQTHLCLAHQGHDCQECVEQCPVSGAMSFRNGIPVIDTPTCTGCGVCQFVCRAPQNAVIVLALADRTAPQADSKDSL
jgi:ferredoxin-type protein NapG